MLVPGTPFLTLAINRSRVLVFMNAALVRSRGLGSR